MDANGRPRMSRDMMGRIMHSQPATQPAAYGSASAQPSSPAQRSLHARGDRVGGYGTSRLGARSMVRQFGTEISAPSASRTSQTGRSRHGSFKEQGEHINSQQNRPSAGFREPPARNYNPYA